MRHHLLPLLLTACTTPALDTDTGADTADASDTAVATGCRAGAPRPDADRYGVVSLPYTAAGGQAPAWEVVRLAPSGTLHRTGTSFTMGRAFDGVVRFTPDGSLGLAVQEDGSLGVFTLGTDGAVAVLDAAFSDDGKGGSFYASDVLIDDDGERAWVVDGNWANNGGGIYAIALPCETGRPVAGGLVVGAKLARHLFPAPGGRHVVVAREVGDDATGHAYLVDLAGPTVVDAVRLWPDDDAIAGGAALAGDGAHLVVGDVSAFSGVPNRLAVARLDADTLTALQVLSPVEDPTGIGAWGAATLVASGFGDALIRVSYAPGSAPFAVDGPLSTTGGAPQIPSAVVTVAAPDGDGWMLVPEVKGVRVVRATASGGLTDLGVSAFGDGLDNLPGALGLQP